MNRRYMDFVPVKSETGTRTVKKSVEGESMAKKSATKRAVAGGSVVGGSMVRKSVARKPSAKTSEAMKIPKKVPKEGILEVETEVFLSKEEPKFGVVEELNPKFIKTEVPKRPLGGESHFSKKTALEEAKMKKVGGRRLGKKAAKAEQEAKRVNSSKDTYKMPTSPFINQAKITKRPLSKNVYQKKIVAPKEEASGPVTIISKPEKEKHVGIVVTIILTIILGAAAGTVAFLILPK